MNVTIPQTLGLIKVDFHLPETNVQTQCIVLQGEVPSDLYFEFIVSSSDLKTLNFEPASPTLSGLVYEFPLAETEIEYLRALTSVSKSEYLFFSDTSQSINNLFALTEKKELSPGCNSSKASFCLFDCRNDENFLKELVNNKNIIRILKRNKSIFIKNAQLKQEKLSNCNEELKGVKDNFEFLETRIKYLKEEIENAKMAARQMEFQVNKKRAQLDERKSVDMDCKSCIVASKSSALIPCGHVVYCSSCVIQLFSCKSSIKKCLICESEITDYTIFKLT